MPEQVFHFDRDVVGQRRVGGVQRLDNAERVRRPVEEFGSPNVMCSAPAATCAATSASTTSGCTTRNWP